MTSIRPAIPVTIRPTAGPIVRGQARAQAVDAEPYQATSVASRPALMAPAQAPTKKYDGVITTVALGCAGLALMVGYGLIIGAPLASMGPLVSGVGLFIGAATLIALAGALTSK